MYELIICYGCRKTFEAFQLVYRTSGMSESSSAHLGNGNPEAGYHRGQNKGCLIADTAGGMLVDLESLDRRQIQFFAGIQHSLCKIRCFFIIHTVKEDSHHKGRHLVIGYLAFDISVYEKIYLFLRKSLAVSLLPDDVYHQHGVSSLK